MNKMCHTPTFYIFGPVILLFSFLITGCADGPNEIRYDDSVRTYVDRNTSGQKTYTAGQYDKVTDYYILRPGDRPLPKPGVIQARQARKPVTNQAQVAEAAPLSEKPVAEMPLVLEITDILFEFDKWVIRQAVVPELDQWVEFFQTNPTVTAEIYGHADSTGPDTYNQELSGKRAQAVVNYLIEKGVDPKRLTARGLGESQPVAPNVTSEGRQKNRRVELSY